MVSSAECIHVLSSLPGRLRLHLPGFTEPSVERIETLLSQVKGIESVKANPLTGNALVRFDHRTSDEDKVVAGIQMAWGSFLAELERQGALGCATPTKDGSGRSESLRPATAPLVKVGMRAVLGHAVVDSLWFGAGFLGEALGLPLAGLGPLHVAMDLVVWGMALGSMAGGSPGPTGGVNPTARRGV